MRTPKLAHPFAAILFLAAGLAFTATHGVAAPLFGPGTAYGTNGNPQFVAVGDLNGDGKLDLAVACYDSSTVSVLLGDGSGGFGPHSDFDTGDYPTSVAIGDLDDDGNLDLVTSNQVGVRNLCTVSVLLGNGDGSFGPKTDYLTGDFPQQVAIGDLDADGDLDLATANFESLFNKVSVLLGNGDGTFGPKTDYGTGRTPASVAIGDLNADGKPDLVTSNWGTFVSVLLGTGDGSFGPFTSFLSQNTKVCVALGDLNADGKLDAVTATWNFNAALVLLGNGDGTLGPAAMFDVGNDPSSVAIADLDEDGDLDLAVASPSSGTVSILRGNGDGSFAPKIDHAVVSARSVAIGDVNGDGRPDLVISSWSTNTVSVLLNLGPGTLSVGDGLPSHFDLAPPRPNPFRAGTTIAFAVSSAAPVRLEVYDVQGRWIRTLHQGVTEPGVHTRSWDGTTAGGSPAKAGVYIVRFSAPGVERAVRAALIR